MESQQVRLQGKKVLIVDDDLHLGQILKIVFKREGANAYVAINGREGLQTFFAVRPDLVILDVMMPEMNGWEVCKQIRMLSDTPIIMLTTLSRDEDTIFGLDYGADDFVSKPCSGKVLLARARATLRRTEMTSKTYDKTNSYNDNYLKVDLEERKVVVDGHMIKLTATEFRMLAFLLENAGRVLTYNQILDQVWGWEYRDSVDYVHVYASHLRRKLERDPKRPRYLLTEHGVGYRFISRN